MEDAALSAKYTNAVRRASALHQCPIQLGMNAQAGSEEDTAVGCNSVATGLNSTAYGYQASAVGDNAIAMGVNAHADEDNAIALGTDARAGAGELALTGRTVDKTIRVVTKYMKVRINGEVGYIPFCT